MKMKKNWKEKNDCRRSTLRIRTFGTCTRWFKFKFKRIETKALHYWKLPMIKGNSSTLAYYAGEWARYVCKKNRTNNTNYNQNRMIICDKSIFCIDSAGYLTLHQCPCPLIFVYSLSFFLQLLFYCFCIWRMQIYTVHTTHYTNTHTPSNQ